jgi:uncharacterized GH25 family protein
MKGKQCRIARDTTDLMVYGHEGWLEMTGSHGHVGSSTELLLKHGHNMKTDGQARRDGMTAVAVSPDGTRQDLAIEEGGDDHYLLRLSTPAEGFYHVYTTNTGNYCRDKEGKYLRGSRSENPDAAQAILFNQFAQAFVPVGHDLEGVPQRAGLTLEIAPAQWKQWRAGDKIALQVLFRGVPLDGIVVDMVYNGPDGYRQWQEMTGNCGCGCGQSSISIEAKGPGYYMAVARYQTPDEEGAYDTLALTGTLRFTVIKA